MKDDREILVGEICSLRDLTFQLCKWGVTILMGLQIVIYYIRKSMIAELVQKKVIEVGQSLPLIDLSLEQDICSL